MRISGASRRIHASIILNLHRESVFLARTLLSWDAALGAATAVGLNLEIIAVLDRTDNDTRAVLAEHDFGVHTSAHLLEVDNGSLGLSRNYGIGKSSGEIILTADGDDLVSENFLLEMVACAQTQGPDALYFPEYLLGFGTDYYVSVYRELIDVTPMAFVDTHPFVSRVCAHRDVFRRIPYADVCLTRGYAYEDWHFNSEAVAAGLDIRVVPDTILFYRQRPGSLQGQARTISIGQIPPSKLFEPQTYIRICGPYLKAVSSDAYMCDRAASPSHAFLRDPQTRTTIAKANAIEPAITLSRYEGCRIFSNVQYPLTAGIAYHTVCKAIRGKTYEDVFLFPFMSRGGAERYFLALMEAMYKSAPLNNSLALLGEDFSGPSWLDKLPPNVTVINMPHLCGRAPIEQRCLIALKTIQSCCRGARIHIRQSGFGDTFLKCFGIVFQGRDLSYYRFADEEGFSDGRVAIRHSPLELISESFQYLSRIITDNETAIRKDHHRIGVQKDKWKCLYAPVEIHNYILEREADAGRRVLWASRLDASKRPSLIPFIASELAQRDARLSIDVHGSSVFGEYGPESLNSLPNVQYCGPYDGFSSLPLERYSTFLYTSWCDGIPNVLLEAMAAGLVVIAPDVGGVSEVVIDGVTGILLPSVANDADMAKTYADSIVRLQADPDFAVRMVRAATDLIRERHSPGAHARRVAKIFNLRGEVILHG